MCSSGRPSLHRRVGRQAGLAQGLDEPGGDAGDAERTGLVVLGGTGQATGPGLGEQDVAALAAEGEVEVGIGEEHGGLLVIDGVVPHETHETSTA